jgi:hypothetical protein
MNDDELAELVTAAGRRAIARDPVLTGATWSQLSLTRREVIEWAWAALAIGASVGLAWWVLRQLGWIVFIPDGGSPLDGDGQGAEVVQLHAAGHLAGAATRQAA